jgi:hypothetical protein
MTVSINITSPAGNSMVTTFPFSVTGNLSGISGGADSISMNAITFSLPASASTQPPTSNATRNPNNNNTSPNWSFSCNGPGGLTSGDAFFVCIQAVDAGDSPDRVISTRQFVFQPGVGKPKKSPKGTKAKTQKATKPKPKKKAPKKSKKKEA